MKDLSLRDIYPRKVPVYNKLSIYQNGAWKFAVPVQPLKVAEGSSYYRINKVFGIVANNQTNPKKFAIKAKAGDFLVEDQNKQYQIMTKAQYKLYFPRG